MKPTSHYEQPLLPCCENCCFQSFDMCFFGEDDLEKFAEKHEKRTVKPTDVCDEFEPVETT